MSAAVVYDVREGQKFAAETSLTVVTCATCRMTYAIPTGLYKSALKYPGESGGWKLTCPLGHTWWYLGESVDDQLERERRRSARLAAERDQAEASARSYKGAATRARHQRDRLERRAAAGVCPCCNRTFKQLARHMAGQHPDFPAVHSE